MPCSNLLNLLPRVPRERFTALPESAMTASKMSLRRSRAPKLPLRAPGCLQNMDHVQEDSDDFLLVDPSEVCVCKSWECLGVFGDVSGYICDLHRVFVLFFMCMCICDCSF